MGIVLEAGKISSLLWLHWHWSVSPKLIKLYLVTAVIVLMLINSIGIFGYLSRAHIEQEIINTAQTTNVEIVDTKIENEKSTIEDINTQIKQLDTALSKLTDQGKAQTSLNYQQQQRKARADLVTQKIQHQQALQKLNEEKVGKENDNAKVLADFGPLTYIADAFYGSATKQQLESTVRWIISVLVFVFDPLALVLLIASQYSFANRKKRLTPPPNDDNVMHYKGFTID